MDRITAIRRSLAAFVCGILGLLPVLGLIPAVWALGLSSAVRSQYRDEWNPAVMYLRAGVILAILGILNTVLLVAVLAFAIATD